MKQHTFKVGDLVKYELSRYSLHPRYDGSVTVTGSGKFAVGVVVAVYDNSVSIRTHNYSRCMIAGHLHEKLILLGHEEQDV